MDLILSFSQSHLDATAGSWAGWWLFTPSPAVQWVKIYIIICLASKISSLSFKLKIFSAHCPAGAALLRLLDKC